MSITIRSVLALGLLFGSLQFARTQDQVPPPPVLQNPGTGENLLQFFTSKTPYEFWLTCLIALLGLAIIWALVFGLRRFDVVRPEELTRPVIVITVIIGTLILVTVGYSNQQIAPAFGLFGTIVGYMLGRLDRPSPAAEGGTGQTTQAPAAQDGAASDGQRAGPQP